MHLNIKRIYTLNAINPRDHITLTSKQIHYIKNVLRIKKNEILRIFNGIDGEWLAKVEKIEKKQVVLFVEKKIRSQENSPKINLFFSMIKKERINILIQKCTELGILNFYPIVTERSNVRNINIKKLQQNAIEATQQCERLDVPLINQYLDIFSISHFLGKDECLIYCDEKNFNAPNIISTMKKIKNIYKKWSLVVGPEGGFTAKERDHILKTKRVYPITLGKRILRSDTAATVVLFCLQQFVEN